jgi:hypothetical protein
MFLHGDAKGFGERNHSQVNMNISKESVVFSMPTPPTHTQQIPMPVCRYEVLNGSPEGAPVFYATIGQMVSFSVY